MKKILLLLTLVLTAVAGLHAQSVGIGTTSPNTSAALDISATNKGLLIPQINLQSTTNASTVPSPAVSLLVYNTNATLGVGYYYNAGTTTNPNWTKLASSSSGGTAWNLTGNTGTTTANFIGTTDNHSSNNPLRFVVNGGSAGILDSALSNASYGLGALRSNTTGTANTAVGSKAMFSTTIGTFNSASMHFIPILMVTIIRGSA